MLGVPLIVEGELIGVLHVGSLVPRTFDQRDLAVLELAAARVAPGIERARLFRELERERRSRYCCSGPASAAAANDGRRRRDGGSVPAGPRRGRWGLVDVLELPRGRLGVAIGDVVGHGLRAAALMGRLRTALHAYALEGTAPARTLELVDRFVQSMASDAMATPPTRCSTPRRAS